MALKAVPQSPAAGRDVRVVYAGGGRGWYVVEHGRDELGPIRRTLAGPFTSATGASDRREELLAELAATEHSVRVGVGAAIAGRPFAVVNLEAEPRELLGTYRRTVEDTVEYLDDAGELRHAPEDCVAVVGPGRVEAVLAGEAIA